ncbi:MAG: hypothetical protein RIQ54_293 [Candidatus Parcubacteria bacterium]
MNQIFGKIFSISMVACLFVILGFSVPVRAQEVVLEGTLVRLKIEVNRNGQKRAAAFFESRNNKDSSSSSNDQFVTDRYYRYAEVKEGDTYKIAIDLQDKSRKILVCAAVDGINVATGKKVAGDIEQIYAWQNGYITDQTQGDTWDEIAGWRSGDTVRDFVVTEFSNSVAANSQDWSAPGTIVIAVFRGEPEKPASRGSSNERGGKGLGTGAGSAKYDPIEVGEFIPKQRAYEIFVIKYENRETLEELGLYAPSSNRFWIEDEKPTKMKMRKKN